MSANNADFDSAPEPFRGTRSQVGPFLAQLDEEFKAQPDVFSSDHAKVSLPIIRKHLIAALGTHVKSSADSRSRTRRPTSAEPP